MKIESVIEDNVEVIKDRWNNVDEDLSFEGMFAKAGLCSRTESEDSVYWEPHAKEYPTHDEESTLFVAED